jgi:hypothetical protein
MTLQFWSYDNLPSPIHKTLLYHRISTSEGNFHQLWWLTKCLWQTGNSRVYNLALKPTQYALHRHGVECSNEQPSKQCLLYIWVAFSYSTTSFMLLFPVWKLQATETWTILNYHVMSAICFMKYSVPSYGNTVATHDDINSLPRYSSLHTQPVYNYIWKQIFLINLR